jgi:hypothetical protein
VDWVISEYNTIVLCVQCYRLTSFFTDSIFLHRLRLQVSGRRQHFAARHLHVKVTDVCRDHYNVTVFNTIFKLKRKSCVHASVMSECDIN